MSEVSASVYPNLLYRDADAAMDWLELVLGFERREEHRDAEGNVAHAELALDGAVVMLAGAAASREPFRSQPAGGALVYIATDDVAALHERAREAGAEIALELAETDYGSLDFTLRDPEGNLWSLGTYRPPSPA
jgi:uncharacterized glyoxalase superfamily protein PhnB